MIYIYIYMYIYVIYSVYVSINLFSIPLDINIIYTTISKYVHHQIWIFTYIHTYIRTYIHYITLHYLTLPYLTWPDMTWHDMTWHYIRTINRSHFISTSRHAQSDGSRRASCRRRRRAVPRGGRTRQLLPMTSGTFGRSQLRKLGRIPVTVKSTCITLHRQK